ncbi:hypothetical protein [Mycolicibacterium sphagni]|uniref:hypothetical protein n=1 Tax=Mycolicibacterium sphagni TaxID=1786 RepID=UPI0021F2B659|nr:hypothetical protein [Mycolicibacterium sphagni]MCV7179535.1 hypothetical protein [Mycolicibacterium sphagni]
MNEKRAFDDPVVVPPLEELNPAALEWVERTAAVPRELTEQQLRELGRLLTTDVGGE